MLGIGLARSWPGASAWSTFSHRSGPRTSGTWRAWGTSGPADSQISVLLIWRPDIQKRCVTESSGTWAGIAWAAASFARLRRSGLATSKPAAVARNCWPTAGVAATGAQMVVTVGHPFRCFATDVRCWTDAAARLDLEVRAFVFNFSGVRRRGGR